MSADEVTRQLRGWEERLATRAPEVVADLRPGLTRPQVERIAAEYGVRLPADAAAVWMWHDGAGDGSFTDTPTPRSQFPRGSFLHLRAALGASRWLEEVTDDHGDYAEEEASAAARGRPVQLYFRHGFVVLGYAEYSTFLDCTDPGVTSTPTAGFSTWSDAPTERVPLAERIAGWNRAWDAGVWPEGPRSWTTVDEDAARRLFGDGPHMSWRLQ